MAVQGARQTGKSFLIRELLAPKLPRLSYQTFDREQSRAFADTNPETFLTQYSDALPLAIDEAQKVPKIFDAVKYSVDLKRTPGRFILLGSTEFSKLTLIRESLTGRLSRIRLYPMNFAETFELPPNPSKSPLFTLEKPRMSRKDLLTFLTHGGMPGIFAIRSDSERTRELNDWLDLTCRRDALLIPKLKLDSILLQSILMLIATLEEPTAGNIARALKRDLRRVNTHLDALKTLFVINELPPHPFGTGKPFFFLCDVALATLLGASFERQLYTWLVQEQLSQRAYRDDLSRLYFYRSLKGRLIHLLIDSRTEPLSAIKLIPEEKTDLRDFEILYKFREKHPGTLLFVFGSARQSWQKERLEVFPWESLG